MYPVSLILQSALPTVRSDSKGPARRAGCLAVLLAASMSAPAWSQMAPDLGVAFALAGEEVGSIAGIEDAAPRMSYAGRDEEVSPTKPSRFPRRRA
jgi:hypothetical protein